MDPVLGVRSPTTPPYPRYEACVSITVTIVVIIKTQKTSFIFLKFEQSLRTFKMVVPLVSIKPTMITQIEVSWIAKKIFYQETQLVLDP